MEERWSYNYVEGGKWRKLLDEDVKEKVEGCEWKNFWFDVTLSYKTTILTMKEVS